MRVILLTGIGTDVGKTIAAAVLVRKLDADYWKPVQCGELEHTDTDRVRALVAERTPPAASRFHPEAYRLRMPASPHAAARAEGRVLDRGALTPPRSERPLVVEGAGGVLVPLNDRELLIDALAPHVHEVVVVSRNYLGSINHTLLTLEALERRRLRLSGIIFNGERTPESESFILARSGARLIGRLAPEAAFTPAIIARYAAEWDFA